MTEPRSTESPPRGFPLHPAVVDIELTSRCNAKCTFCPRDQTPHQGLIDEATFTAALGRAVEYRDALLGFQQRRPGYFDTHDDTIWLSFCGMGEPLLHHRVVEYVRRVAEAGLRPIVNTNGALLTPRLADALVDAGLAMVCFNVGDIDEDYEAVYGLPFERTRANVEHFLARAPGGCIPVIVLVDHRNDPRHITAMREYWSARGAQALAYFGLVNRAGSLDVDEQADAWRAFRPEATKMLDDKGAGTPRCGVPFAYPFIGYDGNYYLCSSDWRKEVNLGNVFDDAIVDLLDRKAAQVCGDSPICGDCTHEPTNALALSLARAAEARAGAEVGPGAPEELLARFEHSAAWVAAMRADLPRAAVERHPPNRRLIPVRS